MDVTAHARTDTGGTKTMLIVLDGLSNAVAIQTLGYLHALIEAGKARHQVVRCALPSNSRPLYEAILTGKTPLESGITTNDVTRLSTQQSIFHHARAVGLRTAAASYHWISELYNQSPYDVRLHRHQHDESKPIQHGIFYHQDHYPDEALFQDANHLLRTYSPDFLLVHPMNIDYAGHVYGGDSAEYMRAARTADGVMGFFLPAWLEQGWQIAVTADHGMNWDRSHGGTAAVEREVPLYVVGETIMQHTPERGVLQTEIISVLCKTLQC